MLCAACYHQFDHFKLGRMFSLKPNHLGLLLRPVLDETSIPERCGVFMQCNISECLAFLGKVSVVQSFASAWASSAVSVKPRSR